MKSQANRSVKYLISEDDYCALAAKIGPFMVASDDAFTVCNIYFHTDDSAMKGGTEQNYQERVRLRSYGAPKEGDCVFLEVEREWGGTVCKKRMGLTFAQATTFLNGQANAEDGHLLRELDYFLHFYNPVPRLFIAYDREAYHSKQGDLRITFDANVRGRKHALSLQEGDGGKPLLPKGYRLMTVRTACALPLWLLQALNAQNVFSNKLSYFPAEQLMTRAI